MTFLNPLALLALAAAAIPLVVHLFNFRRPRRIDFSSIEFLRTVEKSTMQRVRVQEWLLLLLRTLAVACLVLSFARPILSGDDAASVVERGSHATAIVIDASPSMQVVERAGERFRVARDVALRVIGQSDDREAIFVLANDGARVSPAATRATAPEEVARLSLADGGTTLRQAIEEAARALDRDDGLTKEIIVISDFQRSMLGDETDAPAVDADITLVPVGERTPRTVAVIASEVESRIIDVGQPVSIRAKIRNFSDEPVEQLPVSVYFGDARVAQSTIDLGADAEEEILLEATPSARGWVAGRVGIEGGGHDHDEQRHFAFFVPERRRILVVDGGTTDLRYLRLALSPEVADGRVVFDRDFVSSGSAWTQALGSYDAVVLAGLPGFGSGELATLIRYVEEGGGLLLYPGAGASVESYSELLSGLGGGRIAQAAGQAGSSDAIATLGSMDIEHQLFRGVYGDASDVRAEPAEIYAAMRYIPASGTERTLISLSNGWPLLQEVRSGNGTTFFFSTALDANWTELAVRGLFIPLVYRSMFYLAAADVQSAADAVLGSSLTVRFPDRGGESMVVAVTAGGDEFVPDQERSFGSRRVTLAADDVLASGLVRLVDSETRELRHAVAFNTDPRESDPALATPSEVQDFASSLTTGSVRLLSFDGDFDALERTMSEGRYGRELWNVFLMLALGFLVAEMLVARRWRPAAEAV